MEIKKIKYNRPLSLSAIPKICDGEHSILLISNFLEGRANDIGLALYQGWRSYRPDLETFDNKIKMEMFGLIIKVNAGFNENEWELITPNEIYCSKGDGSS